MSERLDFVAVLVNEWARVPENVIGVAKCFGHAVDLAATSLGNRAVIQRSR